MRFSLEVDGLALTLGVSFFRFPWAMAIQDVRVTRDFQEIFVTLVRRGPALRTALRSQSDMHETFEHRNQTTRTRKRHSALHQGSRGWFQ
jgi:hypothetical protein